MHAAKVSERVSWSCSFEDAIQLPSGRQIVTLEDAGSRHRGSADDRACFCSAIGSSILMLGNFGRDPARSRRPDTWLYRFEPNSRHVTFVYRNRGSYPVDKYDFAIEEFEERVASPGMVKATINFRKPSAPTNVSLRNSRIP